MRIISGQVARGKELCLWAVSSCWHQTHGLSICALAFRHLSMEMFARARHRDWASPWAGITPLFPFSTCHCSPSQDVHFCDLGWQEGQSLCRCPAARDIHFFQLVQNRGCYLYSQFKNSVREKTHGRHPIYWTMCHCWKPGTLSCVQQKTLLPPEFLEKA